MDEPLTVREACKRRHPLDGTDAQALEHALTITERERDEVRAELENLRQTRTRGCQCGDDEACALVRERDSALAELERLRSEVLLCPACGEAMDRSQTVPAREVLDRAQRAEAELERAREALSMLVDEANDECRCSTDGHTISQPCRERYRAVLAGGDGKEVDHG